ncbi:MAG: PqiC family protein [Pseudomonadota bacterium]|nr:PqiC family protein [Pseudomonadota bacterium]
MKIQSDRIGTFLLGALILAGCATTPPSSFYTLTPIRGAGDRQASLSEGTIALGLGPIGFPAFLDRPQIVSRAGTNRLSLDEFHRWGGNLQDDFSRALGQNLAHLLGTSRILVYPADVRFPLDFRVIADVLSFETTPTGEAELKVRWAILHPQLEQALIVRESAYRRPVQGPTPEAKIAALSEVLGGFSRDLADELRRLPKPAPLPQGVEPL